MSLRWYIGNALAGYLDFCVGILIAAVCAAALGKTPPLALLAWGALFALLPDIDQIWPILRGRVDSDHRTTLFHAPAAMFFGLTIFFVALSDIASLPWVLTAYLGLLWHYLHDTPDGVMWLWPLSHRKFPDPGPMQTHEYYLERNWFRFSFRGMFEVVVGTALAIFAGVLLLHNGQALLGLLLMTAGMGTAAIAFIFWSMMSVEASPA